MTTWKIFVCAVALGAITWSLPTTACADSYDVDDSDYPVRYIIYPIHAVGKGVEYLVTRPLHALVSKPKLRYIFGHSSTPRRDDYWGNYNLYERYSY
jgi:hypothetical protein